MSNRKYLFPSLFGQRIVLVFFLFASTWAHAAALVSSNEAHPVWYTQQALAPNSTDGNDSESASLNNTVSEPFASGLPRFHLPQSGGVDEARHTPDSTGSTLMGGLTRDNSESVLRERLIDFMGDPSLESILGYGGYGSSGGCGHFGGSSYSPGLVGYSGPRTRQHVVKGGSRFEWPNFPNSNGSKRTLRRNGVPDTNTRPSTAGNSAFVIATQAISLPSSRVFDFDSPRSLWWLWGLILSIGVAALLVAKVTLWPWPSQTIQTAVDKV